MKVAKLLLSLMIISGGAILVQEAGAMTFQDSVDVQFSIDVSLGITLSSDTILIGSLSPGNSAHSNTITATVATNNTYGYTLSAMVGGTGQTAANNTLYNSTVDASFTSLATSASTPLASFSDNQWGYTTASSLNGANYSGLAYNTGKTINKTANYNGDAVAGYAGTDTTNFTIGAKAAIGQLAGEYSNVITFAAVTNVATDFTIDDITYLQDFAGLTSDEKTNVLSSMTASAQYTVADSRDGQEYTIAKLSDGSVWMTKPLNLAGGTALSSANTDVTSAYISSFATSGNLTKGSGKITLPASSTSGFDTDNYSFVYNSGNTTDCGASGQSSACYSYYSWDAATLGSGRSITADNTNASYSICPKGWGLPTTYNGTDSSTDFRALAIVLGGSDSVQLYDNTTAPTGTAMINSLTASIPGFMLNGFYYDSTLYYGGTFGRYWSATVSSVSSNAYYLYVNTSAAEVDMAEDVSRRFGLSVNCVLR